MQVAAHAAVEIARPIGEVFDFTTSCEGLPRFLFALGPIPGIARAELIGAAQPRAGAERHIQMTDGSVVKEELLDYDRPARHRYRWLEPPAFPFSLLVRSGEGDWHFRTSDGATRIEWIYTFELTSPLVWPLAAPVSILFRCWMQRALLRARSVLES